MKISQEFVVERPSSEVWTFFQDVPSVAQCLPGAALESQNEDGSYEGNLSVKLGPMTAAFEGKCVITPDESNMTAKIEGRGVDKRGGSRGQVSVVYDLTDDPAGCKVVIDADVTLSGPAAQFGRTGLINEMSKRLIGDFVDCIEAKLEAKSPEEAESVRASDVRGLSLFLSSLWSWIKGLFGGSRE
ncbi:MAG TPA: SRPBCC family protein [Acidimicrobiia bacterium]|nr:SRPBCC family protein [Acidimicrobiia bacterium]